MKTLFLILLLALASCDAQQSTTSPKLEGPNSEEQPPQAGDAPQSEGPVETIPSDKEPEIAAKLTADNCIDPDLSKVMQGEDLMLCDGSIGVGTYVPPVIIPQPDLANLVASNIKSGISINGVTGTFAGLPQPDLSNLVAENVKHGVAINGVTGTYAGLPQPDLANLTASNIKSGISINGVTGTYLGAIIPPDCGINGQVNCVTTFTYKAADLTNLTAANVKKGATVAGVVGDYPSSSNPFSDATSVPDLDSTTFTAKIKSGSSFEWFDSEGVRHQATGSSQIAPSNIRSGVNLFGVSGTLVVSPSVVKPWDVRKGVIINGVEGKLDLACLRGASGSLCGDSNWVYEGSGTCDSNPSGCVYRDMMTNLLWARTNEMAWSFPKGEEYCRNLHINGLYNWRLPSTEELQVAHAYGIAKLPYAGFFGSNAFWIFRTNSNLGVYFKEHGPLESGLTAKGLPYARALCVWDGST